MSANTPGHTPQYTIGYIPTNTPDHIIGHPPGHAPGYTPVINLYSQMAEQIAIKTCTICGRELIGKYSVYCTDRCAREGRRLKHLTRTAEASYAEYLSKMVMLTYAQYNNQK